MKTLLLFTAVLGLTSAQLPNLASIIPAVDLSNLNNIRQLFQIGGVAALEPFKTAFVQTFANDELLQGLSRDVIATNFLDNAKSILSNPLPQNWKPSLNMAILGFSKEQYSSLLTATPPPRPAESETSSSRRRRQTTTPPASIDWRTKGAVTAVKNQGSCGSCWSFSATGALEGQLFIKTGKLPVLSEQNLIDCARNVSGKGCCGGCDGGWMTDAYTWVKLNTGIDSMSSYPYEAKQLSCRYNAANKAGSSTGYKYTTQDSEADLLKAVAVGPVATAVDASEMQTYKSGLFKCTKFTGLNHGVLIVGYGTDTSGDYWIVKNSWGTSWGESGYIRIARNQSNTCGIASSANYPLV